MKRVLHITPDFNYSCGRSKLVFFCLKHFGNKDGYETHFITNGGDSLDRLKEITSLKFQDLSFSTGIKNIFYFNSFYKKLKEYIVDNQINLIHTHHRFPELISVKIARELNIKTIASAHSFVKGFRKISYRSDKIISVSNSVKAHLINYFSLSEKKITTLYNPVEKFSEFNLEEKKKIKREIGLDPDKKVLLFVGRISQIKGCDKLIQAYEIVHHKDSDAILIMCGKIEDKNFSKIRNKLTAPVIIISPFKYLNELYQISNIIILPSRIDPFPFVMLETGSIKKPFIGGNTGGIAEFIEDGVNGLLVDPENENELAEQIALLLNDDKVSAELGNNLYKKVNEECDFRNYFNQIEKIYNSLLNS